MRIMFLDHYWPLQAALSNLKAKNFVDSVSADKGQIVIAILAAEVNSYV